MKRSVFFAILAFACVCLLASCKKEETITDVYYVRNSSSLPVTLVFGGSIFWDTCSVYSTATYTHVAYDSQVEIPSGKTIRLHPVVRGYDNPKTHQLNATFIGNEVKLICVTGTFTWNAAYKKQPPGGYYCMFSDDTTWSFFNINSWSTAQDTSLPYTYYRTFSITDSNLERN